MAQAGAVEFPEPSAPGRNPYLRPVTAEELKKNSFISVSASLSAQPGSCARGIFLPFRPVLPFNSHFSLTGQDKCFPCPAGFHCSKGLRHRCPPGFYCPQKTGIGFYPCPPGTYNPSYGLSRAEGCQQCPAGEGMLCWDLSQRVMIPLPLSLPRPPMRFRP